MLQSCSVYFILADDQLNCDLPCFLVAIGARHIQCARVTYNLRYTLRKNVKQIQSQCAACIRILICVLHDNCLCFRHEITRRFALVSRALYLPSSFPHLPLLARPYGIFISFSFFLRLYPLPSQSMFLSLALLSPPYHLYLFFSSLLSPPLLYNFCLQFRYASIVHKISVAPKPIDTEWFPISI